MRVMSFSRIFLYSYLIICVKFLTRTGRALELQPKHSLSSLDDEIKSVNHLYLGCLKTALIIISPNLVVKPLRWQHRGILALYAQGLRSVEYLLKFL